MDRCDFLVSRLGTAMRNVGLRISLARLPDPRDRRAKLAPGSTSDNQLDDDVDVDGNRSGPVTDDRKYVDMGRDEHNVTTDDENDFDASGDFNNA